MIANSGHDEKGRYTGGQAGDQTGTEWQVRSWYQYSKGWNCVLRYPDIKVGEKIAELAKEAANNDNIGYDQGQRLTFWYALEKAKYKPENIKTKCEADCSAGVTAIVKAVGYLKEIQPLKDLSITNYTGSMKTNFRAAGFDVLTDQKYLTSDKYLLPGDILLNEKHHTCINLDVGSEMSMIFDPAFKEGWIFNNDKRKWWYQYEDGSYPKSCWKKISNKWYYFNADGYLATDEYIKSADYSTNGKLYYVDKDGVWDNKTYKWQKDKKGWWLSGQNGWYAKKEWILCDKKWYYAKDNGYLAIGTLTIDGKIYSFNKNCEMVE